MKFAVIGLGVFGKSLVFALMEQGFDVLGIDTDATRVERLSSEMNCTTVDTTSEEALRSVDITTYDVVIVALGADFEDNVLTTAALKSQGVGHVICQSRTVHEREILERVGADKVVDPDSDTAYLLAYELMVGEQERLPLGQEQSVLKVKVPQRLGGHNLAELELEDVTTLVIQRDEDCLLWPPADASWLVGDRLVLMGRNEALVALSGLFW